MWSPARSRFSSIADASLENFGLSPHAPYTASVQLYQLANACAAAFTMPLTTHVAESREEIAMFRERAGPLFDFMAELQRPMTDCGGRTPFRHLWESGAIDADWLLAHMNELDGGGLRSCSPQLPRGAGPHIVHCPGSHRYFRPHALPVSPPARARGESSASARTASRARIR